MPNAVVDQFLQALERLEQDSDVAPMVALFAEGAQIGNTAAQGELMTGLEAVRSFWRMYRETFREVRSSFRTVLADEAHAALEWTSEGMSHTGEPIRYDGVTMLDFADGRITRLYGYYNPGVITRQRLSVSMAHLDTEDLVREIP